MQEAFLGLQIADVRSSKLILDCPLRKQTLGSGACFKNETHWSASAGARIASATTAQLKLRWNAEAVTVVVARAKTISSSSRSQPGSAEFRRSY
jgi:hypothetical protein